MVALFSSIDGPGQPKHPRLKAMGLMSEGDEGVVSWALLGNESTVQGMGARTLQICCRRPTMYRLSACDTVSSCGAA